MEEKKPKRSSFKAVESRWFDENEEQLQVKYPGMWLAIDGPRLVGIGRTFEEAEAAALGNGAADPLFTTVQAKDFQGKVLIR